MIRLLNVISSLNNAGTEKVVMNYLRNMDHSQIVQDFLVLDMGDGYYEEEIKQYGGQIYKIPSFMQAPIANLKARRKFFKEHRYDIVEVHSPAVNRYGYCKEAKKAGSIAIFHLHNTNLPKGLLGAYCLRQVRKYSDQIVSCSKKAAEVSLRGICDKVIPNAINFDDYKFDEQKREKIRAELDIEENIKVIGHVGRFSLEKNQIFLMRAFGKAAEKRDDLILYLKGFGSDLSAIKDEARRLNITDKVIIDDSGSEAKDVYNIFDVFVLPSLHEGLPVVSLESQINGLQMIASDSVSGETNLFGTAQYLRLDEDLWAEKFMEEGIYQRADIDRADVVKTGYDIKTAANERLQEYKDMVTKR